MVKVKPRELCEKKWTEGMLRTISVPCPLCKKKSRGISNCRWCGIKWSIEQINQRKILRNSVLQNQEMQVL